MKYEPNLIYHIYNQGNNKQQIFFKDKNYLYFLQKMRTHLLPIVDILSYCLMPNHFHWLIHTKSEACLPSKAVKPRIKYTSVDDKNEVSDYQQQLSHEIAILLRSYTRAINKQENRSGSLFRRETKSKSGIIDGLIPLHGKNSHLFFKPDNDYALKCFQYIHQNPVEANLVNKPEKWVYSSAMDYAGLRKGTICNQVLAKKLLDL